jgi:hypothetical protein
MHRRGLDRSQRIAFLMHNLAFLRSSTYVPVCITMIILRPPKSAATFCIPDSSDGRSIKM